MDLAMKISKPSRVRVTRSIQSSNNSRIKKFIKKKIIQKPKQIKNSCRCLCNGNYDIIEFPKVWNELRQNKQLCDGVIKCSDGVTFQIHRAILAAVSPYFKALFVNSLKGGSPEVSELTLEDVSSDTLDLILHFAYTGQCRVDETNVEKLLPAADQLDCVGVVQKCCQFLLNELKPDNCLGIFKFARDYFCKDLQDKGWNYIRSSFMDVISNNPEFEDLSFEEIYSLLSDDQLNVRCEESVFDAISIWINKNPEERKQHAYKLFQCVRFGLMNLEYFQTIVKSFPYVDDETKNLLNTAEILLQSIANKTMGDLDFSHPLTRPRIPHEVLFAMGGWSAGSPTNFVETYDTRADRWFLSVHTDAMPRAYHGLVCLNNLIYMIGGFDGDDHFNTVRCFDPIKKEWSERACMYHARCYVSVCILDGEIYAMGGFNGRTRMSSVEKYNPDKNQWELMPSMNKQRSDASAATLNGKIYVAGGFNGMEVLSSAEVYNPQSRQWTFITPMSTARSGISLVEHKGYLYALGGFNGTTRLNSGERYSPSNPFHWEQIPSMTCSRSNFATVVTDDLIFVIGGFDGTTTIAFTECYDDESKEWFEVTPMNLNRSALSACICKGLPNGYEYSYTAKTSPLHSLDTTKPNNSGDGHAIQNTNSKLNCQT